MSPQEMFDKAVNGVMAQGRQSMVGGMCRYRGADGAKCTVGFLVDDDEIAAKMDAAAYSSVGALLRLAIEGWLLFELPAFIRTDTGLLLSDLQSAHDGACPPEYFRRTFYERAAWVAHTNGLSMDGVRKPEEYE